MNRREFTDKITQLLREMIDAGAQPIFDFALRSAEEQRRLFATGKSRCDGQINKSRHQQGLALDIYLVKDDKAQYEWDKTEAEKWHARWMEISGSKEWIRWDTCHFSSDGK